MSAEAAAQLIFGKYQIVRRIAVGGMGEIYLARQTGLPGFERMVILKSLLPDLAAEESFVEQFLDEARVAATLNHPNVVAIYEVGQWEGIYYIAMEYISGRNLNEMRRGSLPPPPVEVVLSIIRDAARGLDHAHHATDVHGAPLNIVHRDVSPQNIMVRQDGVTKVVDFGIARANNREGRTATGMVKGKLAYMAPEQLSGKPVDARTDQFALGAVLWELLTGARLFRGENDLETSLKVLTNVIPTPSSQLPSLPRAVDALVMRMLDRDPDKRYPRLAAVADDLERLAMTYGPGTGERHVSAFITTLPPTPSTPAKSTTGGNFVISLGEQGPTPSPKPRTFNPPAPPGRTDLAGLARDAQSNEATTLTPTGARKLRASPAPAPAPGPARLRVALLAGAALLLLMVGLVVGVLTHRDNAPAPVVVAVPSKAPARAEVVAVAPAPKPPPQVEVRFSVRPAEAIVRVDGAALASPTVKLVSGHASTVVVSAAGFATRELSLAPTRDDVVEVSLEPIPLAKKATSVPHAPHPPGHKAGRHQADKLMMDRGDVFN
jgi:serine/threonine protein kinase